MLVAGCDLASPGHDWESYPSQIDALAARQQPPDPTVESQHRGRAVYEHYCLICHGPEAKGNGFNAAMLDPPPRNFADKAFWKQADNDKLVAVISFGGPAAKKSKLMPAWGHTLSSQQIRDVIAFLRTVPERSQSTDAGEG